MLAECERLETCSLIPRLSPPLMKRARGESGNEARETENNHEVLSHWVGMFLQHELLIIDSLYCSQGVGSLCWQKVGS